MFGKRGRGNNNNYYYQAMEWNGWEALWGRGEQRKKKHLHSTSIAKHRQNKELQVDAHARKTGCGRRRESAARTARKTVLQVAESKKSPRDMSCGGGLT